MKSSTRTLPDDYWFRLLTGALPPDQAAPLLLPQGSSQNRRTHGGPVGRSLAAEANFN
jgi:hypothetical protein